jgi:acetate kinase
MSTAENHVLTLNVGSSSLKYGVFVLARGEPRRVATGAVGSECAPAQRLDRVLEEARAAVSARSWAGIAHRVVHGGPRFAAPAAIDAAVIAELRRLVPFAPEHLPGEIAVIEETRRRFPGVPQVACFDTAFHHDLPEEAQVLPLPQRYADAGVRRYGFHGLSYEFLTGELRRLGDPAADRGRVILAHLGNGASLAALRDGRCVDTSMGFTPAAGLVMGTRTGDLDPGLLPYLLETEGVSASALRRLVNHESGLLGLSGTSADTRDLLAREAADPRAALALAVFCRQARKWIGAFAAVLGGLDTLVFSAGIGEHSAPLRARICAGLEHLGVALDPARNAEHAPVISAAASRVVVRVIPTNEELILARALSSRLAALSSSPNPP